MNKAVFLDRDGVINQEIGDYVYKIEDFKFNTGLFTGLRLLQEYDYKLIIVTNQGGIAKGRYTLDEVNEVHNFMLEKLLEEGIKIDDVYFLRWRFRAQASEQRTASASFEKPVEKAACKLVEAGNEAELIALLHNEAKAI